MHGLIFETSVWLLAESTRLLSVPRQSAFHWSPAWGLVSRALSEGSHTHTLCIQVPPQSQLACPSVGSLCQASYQQACTLLQNLLVLSPMKIEASPMRSPGRLAEVFLGTPRKVDHSCVLFMLRTITEYHAGTSARVDPATALSNPVELHIVKYAEQIRGPTAHHAPWLAMRLGMLLHHWCWHGTNLQAQSGVIRPGHMPTTATTQFSRPPGCVGQAPSTGILYPRAILVFCVWIST